MGKIISKYKELANNPEMSEVWRTALGNEFGGLAQGDNKLVRREVIQYSYWTMKEY